MRMLWLLMKLCIPLELAQNGFSYLMNEFVVLALLLSISFLVLHG